LSHPIPADHGRLEFIGIARLTFEGTGHAQIQGASGDYDRRPAASSCGPAADFIIDAKPHLAGVLTPAEIRTLSDRIGKFDFDAALACLSGIASRLSLNLEGK
jgi:hypothetical protein